MERIRLSNITKNYGDRKIFEIPDLIIQDNQKIGIVGKNGAGKSTFLDIISEDIKTDSGNIKINGKMSYIKQLDEIGTNRKVREASEIKEKLEGHSKALETRLNHLEIKEKPLPEYNIYFVTPDSSKIKSKNMVSCDDFSLEINHKQLLIHAKIYVPSNKKTALLGKNGIGKTTLIKEILSKNSVFSINPQAEIGYFSQDLSILDENISILENVMTDSIQSETTARNVLGNLNIKDNKVYEIVKNLSGGEKVKVALAKLLVSNSNFLILDEPTNFLDIESIEGLELLIKQYTGTVLLISHDKRFVDNVCDNIILFKDKKLVQFDGNYSDYLKYEENKDKNKALSNDRLVLEFRLTKLDSEIALENDYNKKLLLEKERKEILSKLKNS